MGILRVKINKVYEGLTLTNKKKADISLFFICKDQLLQ
jgi:hypothetical protein